MPLNLQKPSNRRRRYSAMAAAAALFLAACAGCGVGNTPIVIDREVVLRDSLHPQVIEFFHPNAIAKTSSGGFVIAGDFGSGRVLGTDSQGDILWTYSEPYEMSSSSPGASSSEFKGAVSLNDGKVFLCGWTRENGFTAGMIRIIDAKGKIATSRSVQPTGNPKLIHSKILKCSRFKDGILIQGDADDGNKGYWWLEKIDDAGTSQWEILSDVQAPVTSGAFADPTFFLDTSQKLMELNMIRVNMAGEVVARRIINGYFSVALPSIVPTKTTKVIGYDRGGKATVYSLDQDLQDAEKPLPVWPFDVTQGFGYALADGSFILFGRDETAAVVRIASSGKLAGIHRFAEIPSYTVGAAVPLSESQFVVIRQADSLDSARRGIVMTWITLK